MTLIDQVFEHIREHPTDTPTQIGKALGIERNHVSAYIIKLRDKGYISSFYDNGVKTYKF